MIDKPYHDMTHRERWEKSGGHYCSECWEEGLRYHCSAHSRECHDGHFRCPEHYADWAAPRIAELEAKLAEAEAKIKQSAEVLWSIARLCAQ